MIQLAVNVYLFRGQTLSQLLNAITLLTFLPVALDVSMIRQNADLLVELLDACDDMLNDHIRRALPSSRRQYRKLRKQIHCGATVWNVFILVFACVVTQVIGSIGLSLFFGTYISVLPVFALFEYRMDVWLFTISILHQTIAYTYLACAICVPFLVLFTCVGYLMFEKDVTQELIKKIGDEVDPNLVKMIVDLQVKSNRYAFN